jgi:hypothetical protein
MIRFRPALHISAICRMRDLCASSGLDNQRSGASESRMIGLDEEMVYRVTTTNPLEPTAGSPRAIIQYWQVSEAELVGQRISAKLAATGVDWMRVSSDGFWRPDVRAQFVTADGAVVLMHYTGLVEQPHGSRQRRSPIKPPNGTSNTCGFPSHSIPAMRAMFGLTKVSLSQPAGCLAPGGSNTPFTGLPSDGCHSPFRIMHNCLDD